MYLEEPAGEASIGKPPAAPLSHIGKETLIPAIVCAGVSVLLLRAALFSFFFLAPLGVCAVVFGPLAAWLGVVFAALGNGLWSGTGSHFGMETLFFTALIVGFTWMMAGSPPKPVIPPVRTAFRFIAASVAGALVFLAMIFLLGNDEEFSAELRSQIEAVASSSISIAASGNDAVQRAFLEQTLTADKVIELFLMVFSRGGALFSAMFLLFFNRQLAFIVARLFPRYNRRQRGDLIGFHAPRRAIWVFSLCLPVILLCRMLSLGMIETAAWNVLVICVIMFLAQGGGIALFYLARRPIPMVIRLIGIVAFVCVIFSPGINVMAVTLLILLGIAENWLPLRVTKQETPGIDG